MDSDEAIPFITTSLIFLLFGLGLVIAVQGVVGKDLGLFTPVWGQRWNPRDPPPRHPPDQHRLLRFTIGVAIMAIAVVLAIVLVG